MATLETTTLIIEDLFEIIESLTDGIFFPEHTVHAYLKDLADTLSLLNMALDELKCVPIEAMDFVVEGWLDFGGGHFRYSEQLDEVIEDHCKAIACNNVL